jgi:hypothetical protein
MGCGTSHIHQVIEGNNNEKNGEEAKMAIVTDEKNKAIAVETAFFQEAEKVTAAAELKNAVVAATAAAAAVTIVAEELVRKQQPTFKSFLEHKAIFMTDMRSFTYYVRKGGIIHYASLVLLMRDICKQCLESCGVEDFWFKADGLTALFKSEDLALSTAFAIEDAIQAYNLTVRSPKFALLLGGCAVGLCEGCVFVDPELGQPFGSAVDTVRVMTHSK